MTSNVIPTLGLATWLIIRGQLNSAYNICGWMSPHPPCSLNTSIYAGLSSPTPLAREFQGPVAIISKMIWILLDWIPRVEMNFTLKSWTLLLFCFHGKCTYPLKAKNRESHLGSVDGICWQNDRLQRWICMMTLVERVHCSQKIHWGVRDTVRALDLDVILCLYKILVF